MLDSYDVLVRDRQPAVIVHAETVAELALAALAVAVAELDVAPRGSGDVHDRAALQPARRRLDRCVEKRVLGMKVINGLAEGVDRGKRAGVLASRKSR